MPFSGEVTRKRSYKRTIDGSVTFTGGAGVGTLLKRAVGGILTFTGNAGAGKALKRAVGGVVTFTGNIGAGMSLKRSVGGVITFTGDLSRRAFQRLLEGSISFSGRVTRIINGEPADAGGFITSVLSKIKGVITGASMRL